jgi:predicted nucleic acid-binding Zn ribbon protein
MKSCPFCNRSLPNQVTHCVFCGKKIEKVEESQKKETILMPTYIEKKPAPEEEKKKEPTKQEIAYAPTMEMKATPSKGKEAIFEPQGKTEGKKIAIIIICIFVILFLAIWLFLSSF